MQQEKRINNLDNRDYLSKNALMPNCSSAVHLKMHALPLKIEKKDCVIHLLYCLPISTSKEG